MTGRRSTVAGGLLILVSPFALFSCSSGAPDGSAQSTRLDSLREQLDALASSYSDLRARLDSLERERRWAEFDPAASEGYLPIRSSSGQFLVRLDDVEPYADGLQVTVMVGNTTSATFQGGTLDVTWGPRRPDLSEADTASNRIERLGAWFGNLRSRTSEFTEPLPPGAWADVTVNLPSTPPGEFGYFRIGIQTDEVRLRTGR